MKPRVLVLTSTFPAEPGDGVPPFVLDLCAELQSDYTLTVVTPRIPGAAARETIGSIDVERFAYFPERYEGIANGATLGNLRAQPWRVPEFVCLLARFRQAAREAAERIRPDIIHAHWLLPAGVLAVDASRGRAPVVVTVHGVDVHALPVALIDRLRRRTLRRVDRVVAVSSALADRVAGLAPATPVDLVPMGANLAEIPLTFARAPKPGLIGFVGRLAEKKGVTVLLDAVAALPDRRLIIAGDGPEMAALVAKSAALDLEDRVEFLGHADRSSVYELLGSCELLAIPSIVGRDGDQEGTPVVLAEALALGVPVVASRLGGIADHLDDETGWLVEPGDHSALAAALDDAHRDPVERERRAATAFELVSPQLTLDGTAAAYAAIYRELIS